MNTYRITNISKLDYMSSGWIIPGDTFLILPNEWFDADLEKDSIGWKRLMAAEDSGYVHVQSLNDKSFPWRDLAREMLEREPHYPTTAAEIASLLS